MASHVPTVSQDLRLALRRLGKAVVVITLNADGERFAMVATAVNELSLDPPSMIACVNRAASIFPAMDRRTPFCLNILHSSQEAISRNCTAARQGEARFTIGDWATGENALPYLTDAQANIFCENELSLSYGSHDVFIGRVISARTSGEVDPLVYADGDYGRYAPFRP